MPREHTTSSAFNVALSESSKKFNTYKFKVLGGGKERSEGENKSSQMKRSRGNLLLPRTVEHKRKTPGASTASPPQR